MKKYALVGTGGRAGLYISAIGGEWRANASMVAFCDTNQTRMNYANQLLKDAGAAPVSTWRAAQFEEMIRETRPDIIIVTTMDRTHDDYIVRALHAGCDVITEKPMTIDSSAPCAFSTPWSKPAAACGWRSTTATPRTTAKSANC